MPFRTKVSVAELFMDLKKLFPEEYIHFEMPTSDLYLYADRAQIEQVLINLLKNARETCERRTDKNIEIKFFLKATQHSQYLIMVREFCQMFWIRFSFLSLLPKHPVQASD